MSQAGWRALTGVAGVALLAAGGFALRMVHDPEPFLAEARASLVLKSTDHAAPSRFEVQRAERALTRYLEASGSENDSARLLLAVCRWNAGQPADAQRDLEGISFDRCQTSELMAAASAAYRAADFPSANQVIAAVLGRNDDSRVAALNAAILIEYESGRGDDALKHCRELAQLAPLDPVPWKITTAIFEGRSDWPNAVESYRQTLSRIPGPKVDERHVMVDFLLKAGQTEKARSEFEELRSIDPGSLTRNPLLEAKLLYREGKGDEALPAVERALALNPSDAGAWFLEARIRLDRGEVGECVMLAERVVEAEPLNFEAMYLLSRGYYRLGRQEDGDRMLERYRRVEQARQVLYVLQFQANADPENRHVRQELIRVYTELGATSLAERWQRSLGPAASSSRSQ